IIERRVRDQAAAHWIGLLQGAGVPCGVVRGVREAIGDVGHSALTGIAPSVPGSVRLPPPRLDEHGALVREQGWAAFELLDPRARHDATIRRLLRAVDEPPLATVARHLARGLDTSRGFIAQHFSPSGGRMYFTDENAARIDSARVRLHEWREQRLISSDAYHL